MERAQDQSWQGEETFTVGMYRMSTEENSMLWGETRLQALLTRKSTVRV